LSSGFKRYIFEYSIQKRLTVAGTASD